MNHIVLLGDHGVGKTRLFQRLTEHSPFEPYPPMTAKITEGTLMLNGSMYCIYDTPGTSDPIQLIPLLQKSSLVILMYHDGQHYNIQHIYRWIDFITRYTSSSILLVADHVYDPLYTPFINLPPTDKYSTRVKSVSWVDTVFQKNISKLHYDIKEYNQPADLLIENSPEQPSRCLSFGRSFCSIFDRCFDNT